MVKLLFAGKGGSKKRKVAGKVWAGEGERPHGEG